MPLHLDVAGISQTPKCQLLPSILMLSFVFNYIAQHPASYVEMSAGK